ncbi:hypothetical protein PhCBS80983_g05073 [Powellomyces hirtus]|uniref:non-specific serine/threonine protein kinase n=1 Tax=Powellomyces hirtus TaxID=109895 RepID=A0A507DY31_9FUNG|nr:kinase-like domain-containing protein [Powellomyces hirtus]TPX55750.1 hypothetical protein PhCBS80983_g05073 [Powellomyces hirtus]
MQDDLVGTTLPHTSLLLTDVINSGSFATVYHAVNTLTKVPYAVKALEKTGLTKSQSDGLWKEIGIMKRLSNENVPNIVKLEKVVETSEWIFMVLEWCEVDLYDAITQHTLPQHTLLPIFHALCTTLCRLHSLSIYHRDIKPENILLTSGSRRVKLADFGLSTIYPISNDMGCGSTRYMAPECLPGNTQPYDCAKADAWSLGIVLVNLVSGKNPWYEADMSDALYSAYIEGQSVLRETFGFSEEFERVIKSILDPNPITRSSVADIWPRVKSVKRFYDTVEPIASVVASPKAIPTSPIPSQSPDTFSKLFTSSPPRYSKFTMHDSGFESEEVYNDVFGMAALAIY